MKTQIAKFVLLLVTAAAFSGAFSGCALVDPDTSILSPAMWGTIEKNRTNLKQLRVGMTKNEVLKIMGEPMKDEVYSTDDHWWYYTKTCWSDGRATRDECTPLVFDENGELAGWGMDYYREHFNYYNWSDKAVKRILD